MISQVPSKRFCITHGVRLAEKFRKYIRDLRRQVGMHMTGISCRQLKENENGQSLTVILSAAPVSLSKFFAK